MISAYGVGCFDDFLWVYGEGVENPYLDIRSRTEAGRSILRARERPQLQACLSDFGVRPDELVQWGGTDNGDSLLWVPCGPPDDWPTVILEVRQRDAVLVRRPSVRIIFELLTGALVTSIFPDDFPSLHPFFNPVPGPS
jgi:hypothetical protein